MHPSDNPDRKSILETMQASLMALAFGLGILAFLIAIDRPEWFSLRPASGTAAALSNASDMAQRPRAPASTTAPTTTAAATTTATTRHP